MRPLSSFSIGAKLTAIVMVTCSTAILVACTIFAFYDLITFKKSIADNLVTTAEITVSNITAPLAFHDTKAAQESLASLAVQKHIMQARVYNKDGTTLAQYSRGPAEFSAPPAPRADRILITSEYIDVFRQVRLDGEVIGSIYVKSDLGALHARTARFYGIVFIVILLSLAISFILATRLQRLLSGPIGELASTAHEVSLKKDYSVRVPKGNDDELGFLVDKFNEMLEQIEHRESALQSAHDGLERRVETRTRQLQEEIVERKRTEQVLEDREGFLNSLIENLPIAVAVIGDDEALQMCNPAFETLFGYSRNSAIGRSLISLLTTAEIRAEVERAIESVRGGSRVHEITRRSRSDGSLV